MAGPIAVSTPVCRFTRLNVDTLGDSGYSADVKSWPSGENASPLAEQQGVRFETRVDVKVVGLMLKRRPLLSPKRLP